MFFDDTDNSFKILEVRILHMGAKNGREMPARPFNTLSFRIKGGGTMWDKAHRESLKSGSILFMPKDKPFKFESRYERVIVFHFESEKPLPNEFEVIDPDDPKSYQELFESALHTWNLALPGYYYKTLSVFYKILGNLSSQTANENRNYAYQSILPAIERMQHRFHEPSLHIADLCKLVNLSDTQFRKHFVAVFGISPARYLQKLRMEHAVELLESSGKTIEEIAYKSGYNDSKHFSTVFKSVYKTSPVKYRKKK